MSLADRKIAIAPSFTHDIDDGAGRRLRVVAGLTTVIYSGAARAQTYGEAATLAAEWNIIRPLRRHSMPHVTTERFEAIPESYDAKRRDAELPDELQDLANEINEDIREALYTLDSPSLYYPGVDEGIEPVSEEHVALVIWALQRELNRELRGPHGVQSWGWSHGALPAAPLSSLRPDIQRALAERRRLRFKEYGIGREQWLSNTWALNDVPEDPEWVPRRVLRLKGGKE